VERVTWEWIGAGLDEALGFCRELGLGPQVERCRRFQEHRACLGARERVQWPHALALLAIRFGVLP
jgi:hypothetical protein